MTKLEKQREYKRKWELANKDKCAEYRRTARIRDEYKPSAIVTRMYGAARYRTSKSGIEFTITKEQLYKKIVESNGICALSGLPLTAQNGNPLKLSMDRIDNSKGYTPKNIQIVATCVNNAKNDLHQDAFIQMCKAVAEKTK